MAVSAAVAGFLLGGSLIVAIGAQNAFVLRQGLLQRHVLAVTLFCAASDAILILLGVAGFGELVRASPSLLLAVKWGGAAFLLWYAFIAFRRALVPGALAAAETDVQPLSAIIAQCAAFTWLNPHVYLDTVVLLGGLSATYGGQRWAFGAGAAIASFVWFLSLGFGARLLQPVFARPAAWRVLDIGIGCVMALIAFKIATTQL
ncbi:MAG: LysE/ArgO family amino acid transporter [Beijerinckiaceae bacterium]